MTDFGWTFIIIGCVILVLVGCIIVAKMFGLLWMWFALALFLVVMGGTFVMLGRKK